MAPAKREGTKQIHWKIDERALILLRQLVPEPHGAGQYISELILRDAEQKGIIPPRTDQATLSGLLSTILERLSNLERNDEELRSLIMSLRERVQTPAE